METFAEARKTIHTELLSDDSSVRDEYMKHFGAEVNAFANEMAKVVLAWRDIDCLVKGDEKRGYVAALAYAAFTLHLISFKVFLSGNLIAAGNLTRQVVETIALALLCADKSLEDKWGQTTFLLPWPICCGGTSPRTSRRRML
jgi:hypothetical protein